MTLEIDQRQLIPGIWQIALQGRLDSVTAPEFDQQLGEILSSHPPVLHLDLGDLQFITSAGLRSLIRLRKQLKQWDGMLKVLKPQPQVMRVFEIVKIFPLDDIFTSTQELDDYLEALQQQMIDDENDANG